MMKKAFIIASCILHVQLIYYGCALNLDIAESIDQFGFVPGKENCS